MTHTQWFIEEESVVEQSGWKRCEDVPFNFNDFNCCVDAVTGCHHRYPERGVRIRSVELTEKQYQEQERTRRLNQIADDILRQVVCQCGCYRHHGVNWMPEGSGEGLSIAVEILKKAGL